MWLHLSPLLYPMMSSYSLNKDYAEITCWVTLLVWAMIAGCDWVASTPTDWLALCLSGAECLTLLWSGQYFCFIGERGMSFAKFIYNVVDEWMNMALGDKPVSVPICPPKIPHGMAWDRNRASSVLLEAKSVPLRAGWQVCLVGAKWVTLWPGWQVSLIGAEWLTHLCDILDVTDPGTRPEDSFMCLNWGI